MKQIVDYKQKLGYRYIWLNKYDKVRLSGTLNVSNYNDKHLLVSEQTM